MKEVYKPDLKVGDVVYVPHNIRFTRFTYYTKEKIVRITPKRTKFITDKGEYDRYTSFYSEDNELLHKDEIARAYMTVRSARSLISLTDIGIISNEKLLALSEHMKAVKKILNEDKEPIV